MLRGWVERNIICDQGPGGVKAPSWMVEKQVEEDGHY